jgi:hypothetical protein
MTDRKAEACIEGKASVGHRRMAWCAAIEKTIKNGRRYKAADMKVSHLSGNDRGQTKVEHPRLLGSSGESQKKGNDKNRNRFPPGNDRPEKQNNCKS